MGSEMCIRDSFGAVENRSSATSAQFRWSPFQGTTAVKIAFASNAQDLSGWDGQDASLPPWSGQSAGANLVRDYSRCTEGQSNGSLGVSVGAEHTCGFSYSVFPFSAAKEVYFRIVGESETEMRLSQLFVIRANLQPPVLSSLNNQQIEIKMNETVNGIAVSLSDADSPELTCASALKVSSSNTTLIPAHQILVGGSKPDCKISFTPTSGQAGSANLTVLASDGSLTDSQTFTVTVLPPPSISYSGATGTLGSVGSPMSASPTTINDQGSAITNCTVSPAACWTFDRCLNLCDFRNASSNTSSHCVHCCSDQCWRFSHGECHTHGQRGIACSELLRCNGYNRIRGHGDDRESNDTQQSRSSNHKLHGAHRFAQRPLNQCHDLCDFRNANSNKCCSQLLDYCEQ